MVKKLVIVGNPKVEFDNSSAKKAEAAERYLEIRKLLKKNRDVEGIAFIEDLFNACISYVEKVLEFQVRLGAIKQKHGSGPVFKASAEALDQSRKAAHDSLIAKRDIVNRYISRKYGWKAEGGKIPPGGICTLKSHEFKIRRRVGDWAWYLVAGFYNK